MAAGPTREPVDDVRFLGNRSSGKMGAALAAAAAARGAEVTLLAGPGTPNVQARQGAAAGAGWVGSIARIDVETAADLERALASVDRRRRRRGDGRGGGRLSPARAGGRQALAARRAAAT